MPIYMDRHDIPEEITAEHVALMHQEDLKVQHLYGCKGMTYWCDEDRRTAFCLIEAPNEKAIEDMHNNAHGEVPHRIIEVNKTIVESFLGRIEDPEKSQNTELNIINDPAFRVIMLIETSDYLHRLEGNQFSLFTQKFHNSVTKSFKQFKGCIVKQNNSSYLVSFVSVSDAILCALKIQYNFKYITTKYDTSMRTLNMGISSGVPVTNKDSFFEETITLATRLCEIVNDQIVITSEIKSLYESENRNQFINKEHIRSINKNEEKFLTDLMDFVATIWNKPDFNVNDFSTTLGYSKSQLNRKLKSLTGKSPNNFIVDYKLQKALKALHDQQGNISEIAFETGFNSPAYFSTCFKNKFGMLPSQYLQQHVV
ncbi:Regulatory protein PchR [Mariniflexile rhizosphaerae]|uniref:nickel-binding protein n=1 Tax=unclassified Mariniflexile TaxID=2643887 RepID=UPI000CB07DDF|nr:nickel-binding protein [Mariniflexile sp. TRM1-10]AXP79948.1 Regulatory protein PchR [Mariniflexile sp. TRM1-10]PLB21049.1 MAG: Transcriptional regulator, AraC family [Flavobacteriaceae bacterium FS1-H7996/R]